MAYILTLNDPRPNTHDQKLSEQVEMILADGIPPSAHEIEVNDFLVSLREDPNHTVAIRSIDLQVNNITQPGLLTGITTIHYLLIGNEELPYIP